MNFCVIQNIDVCSFLIDMQSEGSSYCTDGREPDWDYFCDSVVIVEQEIMEEIKKIQKVKNRESVKFEGYSFAHQTWQIGKRNS